MDASQGEWGQAKSRDITVEHVVWTKAGRRIVIETRAIEGSKRPPRERTPLPEWRRR